VIEFSQTAIYSNYVVAYVSPLPATRPPYLVIKHWCPPPTPLSLCTQPPSEPAPPAPSLRASWLARVARTPQRERRALRARLERKDAAA